MKTDPSFPSANPFECPSKKGTLCPLSCVKAGSAVRIRELCATPEISRRLREIGLFEDQVIRLVTSRSNFICQVCQARLALSAELAQLILVEPVGFPAAA